jgi:hypothetical protein
MKAAQVRIGWTKSPSQNITRTVVEYQLDGGPVVKLEQSNDIEEFVVEMRANSTISVVITTYKLVGDDEQSASASWSFTVGDLELPLPVSGFYADVLSTYDLPEEPLDPVV